MALSLSQYLDNIRADLRLDPAAEEEVMSELQAHIEDRIEEMRGAGLKEEEATKTCLELLGSAKLLGRQLYEVYSQGTWRQALLASIPHLLFALLFALNWWRNAGWLAIFLGFIFVTTLYGWRHGKPLWLFPWLSYSLLPVVLAGLLLLYLPKGWAWTVILIYLPLALWLVGSITIETIKRDWLYAALMLLPIPVVIGWFLAVEQEGRFYEHLFYFAPWIKLSFLALAITAAAFVRLRKRWLRVALLFISGYLTLVMMVNYAGGRLGLPIFIVLTLGMLGLWLGLVLMERKLRRRQRLMA